MANPTQEIRQRNIEPVTYSWVCGRRNPEYHALTNAFRTLAELTWTVRYASPMTVRTEECEMAAAAILQERQYRAMLEAAEAAARKAAKAAAAAVRRAEKLQAQAQQAASAETMALNRWREARRERQDAELALQTAVQDIETWSAQVDVAKILADNADLRMNCNI